MGDVVPQESSTFPVSISPQKAIPKSCESETIKVSLSDQELVANMSVKRSEAKMKQVSNDVRKGLTDEVDDKPNWKEIRAEQKLKKGESKKLSSERGQALEYVRMLRKIGEDMKTESSASRPDDQIGVGVQKRLLAATSHIQPRDKKSPVDKSDEEESGAKVENFVHVSRYSPPDVSQYTSVEVTDLLFSKVIHNDHDIVALWKPYGMDMFPSSENKGRKRAIESFLPGLAKQLGCQHLFEVHRLDNTTTGVLLYAKTKVMEEKLRKMFAEKKMKKTYLAICNGVPRSEFGEINIPIGEGKIQDRFRMSLRPDYDSSKIIGNKKTSGNSRVSQAVTEYRLMDFHGNASLVEATMMTGKKHQIRLHLGLGLGCPVLGDNKYSQADQMDKPQRVKGDIVERLKMRRSKTRDLPIFLHASQIVIPDIIHGKNLVIAAKLPHFFNKTMKKLRLKINKS